MHLWGKLVDSSGIADDMEDAVEAELARRSSIGSRKAFIERTAPMFLQAAIQQGRYVDDDAIKLSVARADRLYSAIQDHDIGK